MRTSARAPRARHHVARTCLTWGLTLGEKARALVPGSGRGMPLQELASNLMDVASPLSMPAWQAAHPYLASPLRMVGG